MALFLSEEVRNCLTVIPIRYNGSQVPKVLKEEER